MNHSDWDWYRQGIYNRGASIVAQYNAASDVTAKQAALIGLQNLMSEFKAKYDSIIGSSDYGYVTPRFHDFYDFFIKIIGDWQAEIATMVSPQSSGGSSMVGAVSAPSAEGCTAGICGPVPPSTPLQTVQVGAPNAQGQYSTATSGGGGVIGNNMPLQSGGLAPSPFQNDLPGSLTPTSLTPTGAKAPVLAAGIPGSFSLTEFFKGPMILAGLAVLSLVLLLKGMKRT